MRVTQSRFKDTLHEIAEGRKGTSAGLSMGLDRFVDYVPGVQRRSLYVIGGETGSGKSAFGLNAFVYSPFEDWKTGLTNTKDIQIFYWTLEMHPNMILAKAVCRKMYLDHKILVDVNYVLSRGKNRISSEVYNMVTGYMDYFAELEDHIIFIPGDNPTGVYNTIEKYMASVGTIHRTPVMIKDQKTGKPVEAQFFSGYTQNRDVHVIAVVDHVALLKKERDFGKKANIDKLSDYAIELRNRYGVTFAFIQQLNRNLSSTDRFKLGTVEPQLSDFKETSDTTDAADVVLALFSPQRYDLKTHRGFDVRKLQDRFRYLKLLKQRDGLADIGIGLEYVGEVGLFRELPRADEMTDADYSRVMLTRKSY